jgi:uncharacterized protein YkwD
LAVAATHLPSVGGAIAVGNHLPQAHDESGIALNDFLNETNTARVAVGLEPLHLNSQLNAAAYDKATDMVMRNYWDHFSPDGMAPWDFIKREGYVYHYAGENLARGFKTAHGITEAWIASPTHRANLYSPHYTEVGFATAMGTNDKGERVLLTVQLFGAP